VREGFSQVVDDLVVCRSKLVGGNVKNADNVNNADNVSNVNNAGNESNAGNVNNEGF
jgi:hypothetical protein